VIGELKRETDKVKGVRYKGEGIRGKVSGVRGQGSRIFTECIDHPVQHHRFTILINLWFTIVYNNIPCTGHSP